MLKGGIMKARIVLATLVGCFAGLALYAADPNLGTWKLNESKSKLAHPAPRTPWSSTRPSATV